MDIWDVVAALVAVPGWLACIALWEYTRRVRKESQRMEKLINRHERALASLHGHIPTLLHLPDDGDD